MKPPVFLNAMLLLGGCAAASLSSTLTAGTPSAVSDVFSCAREQVQALGYSQTSIDVRDHRLTARRIDETVRKSDVRFRRSFDDLEIEVGPQASGETGLTIVASTFSEYVTQRGFTLEQERASNGVKAAAQSILEMCGQ